MEDTREVTSESDVGGAVGVAEGVKVALTVSVSVTESGAALATVEGTGRLEVSLATGDSKVPSMSSRLYRGSLRMKYWDGIIRAHLREERRVLGIVVWGVSNRIYGCEIDIAGIWVSLVMV